MDTATDTTVEAAIKAVGLRGGRAWSASPPSRRSTRRSPKATAPRTSCRAPRASWSPATRAHRGRVALPDHRVMEITGYDLRENVAVHVMCDYIEHDGPQRDPGAVAADRTATSRP